MDLTLVFVFTQHMVRMRWDNLTSEGRQQMTAMAGNLMQESANPSEQWTLKNRVAGLMAEVSYLPYSVHFIRVPGHH